MRLPLLRLSVLAALTVCINASAQSDDWQKECLNANDQATSAASDLADRARRLQRCAEAGDYSDDCSTEFRRVKNAQSNYEAAVTEVSSKCE
jgi:hypothetical protein